jgi:Na+/proline symporter
VVDLLPIGFKGLMVAAFAAAYMSTISTQLNWGASYIVNDMYLRFIDPRASNRRVIALSRIMTALIFLLSSGVTYVMYRSGSIEGAWRILIALGAGTGLVYILRWYWWRINAWTEIAAMSAAFVSFVALTATGTFNPVDPLEGAYLMLVTTAITTVVWIAVAYLTPSTDAARLESFYRRVRPGGPGWRAVRLRIGLPDEPIASGALSWVNWIAGVVSVYATLFGVGKLIFGPPLQASLWLILAIAAFSWLGWSLSRESAFAGPPPTHDGVPAGTA